MSWSFLCIQAEALRLHGEAVRLLPVSNYALAIGGRSERAAAAIMEVRIARHDRFLCLFFAFSARTV